MAAPDYTVIRVGSDTSGRSLYFTRYAHTVWQAVLRDPSVAPFAHLIVIVQGAFMLRAGGGASASAGYHDYAGCWDIRTWNLTKAQIDALIRALRKAAIAAWRRDLSSLHGGMDEHIHVTFGADYPLSGGAKDSWAGYVRGTNGLANGARDYEWRPSPLVTRPPAHIFQEDYMATTDAEKRLTDIQDRLSKIETALDATATVDHKRWSDERQRDRAERLRQSQRYSALVAKIGALVDQLTGEAREAVLAVLRDEPDVTGVDNPSPESEK